MAHSWIEAFDKEEEAFSNYNRVFPDNTILLIDTYDTIEGAKKAIGIKKGLKGVRLDSGDLADLSKRVRKILDDAGRREAKIIASGNLNEYEISELVKKKAPIDIFGVGTDMVTSKDLPSLDLTYKLVQVENNGVVKPKAKTSEGKETLPGRKQVFRVQGRDGTFTKDIIGLFSQEPPRGGEPILAPMVENGKLVQPLPGIEAVRSYAQERIRRLPACCLKLRGGRYLKTETSIQAPCFMQGAWLTL